MKIQKKNWGGGGGGGGVGSGGGGGGGGEGRVIGSGWGGQAVCERRIEVFVKIQKKKLYIFFGGEGGRG